MKTRTVATLAVVLVACALSAGCVTGRRMIALETPVQTPPEAARGTIVIGAVTDARKFENKPPQPSTPSIDGDVNSASRDTLKTMIGRQRNGYGAAMGDVALANGATVESQTRSLIAEGLKRRGYNVSDGGGADALTVNIDEFWGWFSPGFATVSFEARIRTALSMMAGGEKRELVVNGYGINKGQVASDANWQIAYARAFEDYLKNLDTALAGAGL